MLSAYIMFFRLKNPLMNQVITTWRTRSGSSKKNLSLRLSVDLLVIGESIEKQEEAKEKRFYAPDFVIVLVMTDKKVTFDGSGVIKRPSRLFPRHWTIHDAVSPPTITRPTAKPWLG